MENEGWRAESVSESEKSDVPNSKKRTKAERDKVRRREIKKDKRRMERL